MISSSSTSTYRGRSQFSSPQTASSSPFPRSPESPADSLQLDPYVRHSPSAGFGTALHDPIEPFRGLAPLSPVWQHSRMHDRQSKLVDSPKPTLPSFHSLFGSSYKATDANAGYGASDSDSEDEMPGHQDYDDLYATSNTRMTLFNTSEERGLWKTDPLPPKTHVPSRMSEPAASSPPRPSHSVAARRVSEPFVNTSNLLNETTPKTPQKAKAVPVPSAPRCSMSPLPPSSPPSLAEDTIIYSPRMSICADSPLSSLPPSSPPLSPTVGLSSTPISPITPLLASLPPLSPLSESVSSSDDMDVVDDLNLSADHASPPPSLSHDMSSIPPSECDVPALHAVVDSDDTKVSPSPPSSGHTPLINDVQDATSSHASTSTAAAVAQSPTLLELPLAPDLPPLSPVSVFTDDYAADAEGSSDTERDLEKARQRSASVLTDMAGDDDEPSREPKAAQTKRRKGHSEKSKRKSRAQGDDAEVDEDGDGQYHLKKKPRHSAKSKIVLTDTDPDADVLLPSKSKSTTDPRPKKKKKIQGRDKTSRAPVSSFVPAHSASIVELPPPTELQIEVCGMVIECMATSRASSMTASSLFTSVVQTRPSLKSQRAEQDWIDAFENTLEYWEVKCGVFGKVESSYKASADHALEAQWFYVPERDPDQERAMLLKTMMPRSGKRSETKKYKQYYYQPLGKSMKWNSEDGL